MVKTKQQNTDDTDDDDDCVKNTVQMKLNTSNKIKLLI